jgi:hypothetical protein
LLAIVFLVPTASHALSGTLVDEKGKPVQGARVCYASADVELLCSQSDEAGYWNLPDSRLDRIRVVLRGYLPQDLPAIDRDQPITLQLAATLRVRVLDAATGEPLDRATGEVVYPSGRKLEFVTNRAGAILNTLDPGRATIKSLADGYLPGDPQRVRLVGGEETKIEIRLQAAPPEPAQSESSVSEAN